MSLLLLIALVVAAAAAIVVFLFAGRSVSWPKPSYRRVLTFVACTVVVAMAANVEAGWFRDWRGRRFFVPDRQFYSNSVFADPYYAPPAAVFVGYDDWGRPLGRTRSGRLILLQVDGVGSHCQY